MNNKKEIKKYLFNQLKAKHALWSYDYVSMKADSLTDDQLIEKVLLYLDMDDINVLFRLYPKEQIKDVWKQELCALEPRYHSSNVLFAGLFFGIKNPQRYVKTQCKKAIRNNLKHHNYARSFA
ncbi:MAG: hypothetical protein LBB56_07770 [Chitinispirillales bacterium]|jgi:hypothetical protein|nr:hypothetical protein [Chitinispirillales bacterium]